LIHGEGAIRGSHLEFAVSNLHDSALKFVPTLESKNLSALASGGSLLIARKLDIFVNSGNYLCAGIHNYIVAPDEGKGKCYKPCAPVNQALVFRTGLKFSPTERDPFSLNAKSVVKLYFENSSKTKYIRFSRPDNLAKSRSAPLDQDVPILIYNMFVHFEMNFGTLLCSTTPQIVKENQLNGVVPHCRIREKIGAEKCTKEKTKKQMSPAETRHGTDPNQR
jgi:hypothetical protein